MKRTLPCGFLAVVEGIDGAGKSTVLPALAEYCRSAGFECVQSREPTDGPWGKRLRESAATGRLSLPEELELFLQDRREHVAQLIQPALARGAVVLLDRYYFSTAAYQGARGADPQSILRENESFAPAPDLVLLLDLDPADGLTRVRRRGDLPNEFEREAELAKIRLIFADLPHPFIRRINAAQPREAVLSTCEQALAAALEQRVGVPR